MSKIELANKFTEIVAHHIDVKDQLSDGIESHELDHERWKWRYQGRIPTDGAIVFNSFHPEVNSIVAQLILATEDT